MNTVSKIQQQTAPLWSWRKYQKVIDDTAITISKIDSFSLPKDFEGEPWTENFLRELRLVKDNLEQLMIDQRFVPDHDGDKARVFHEILDQERNIKIGVKNLQRKEAWQSLSSLFFQITSLAENIIDLPIVHIDIKGLCKSVHDGITYEKDQIEKIALQKMGDLMNNFKISGELKHCYFGRRDASFFANILLQAATDIQSQPAQESPQNNLARVSSIAVAQTFADWGLLQTEMPSIGEVQRFISAIMLLLTEENHNSISLVPKGINHNLLGSNPTARSCLVDITHNILSFAQIFGLNNVRDLYSKKLQFKIPISQLNGFQWNIRKGAHENSSGLELSIIYTLGHEIDLVKVGLFVNTSDPNNKILRITNVQGRLPYSRYCEKFEDDATEAANLYSSIKYDQIWTQFLDNICDTDPLKIIILGAIHLGRIWGFNRIELIRDGAQRALNDTKRKMLDLIARRMGFWPAKYNEKNPDYHFLDLILLDYYWSKKKLGEEYLQHNDFDTYIATIMPRMSDGRPQDWDKTKINRRNPTVKTAYLFLKPLTEFWNAFETK